MAKVIDMRAAPCRKEEMQETNRRLRTYLGAGGAGPGLVLGSVVCSDGSDGPAWPASPSRPGRLVPGESSAGAELADRGRLGIPGAPGKGSSSFLAAIPAHVEQRFAFSSLQQVGGPVQQVLIQEKQGFPRQTGSGD